MVLDVICPRGIPGAVERQRHRIQRVVRRVRLPTVFANKAPRGIFARVEAVAGVVIVPRIPIAPSKGVS